MTIEITKKQVSEILVCDIRTVTTYQNQATNPLPISRKGKRGTSNIYDARAVHEWDLQRKISAYLSKNELNEDTDIEHERFRLTKAQADSQEMKNQVLRQELAPLILIEIAIRKWSEQARSMLDATPLKVKKLLPKMKATEIEIIRREIIKIQNAISKIRLDWSELPDDN
ncbi:MAG: terminase small subunit [Desulfobacterales bacterium]|nr:terminase small subunit [Desulfobacterales bacterium]